MKLIALSFLRFFQRTPWTTLTATLGVSLGVASTVAVHLISLAVAGALSTVDLPHLRGVSHLAERESATMDDYFALRRQWRDGELSNVARLTPIVEGYVMADGRRLHVFGTDWYAAPLRFREMNQIVAGDTALAEYDYQPGAVVVDQSLDLQPGDVLRIGDRRWPVAATVSANLDGGVFADVGEALQLLDAPADRLSYVGVEMLDPLADLAALLENFLPGLSAALPDRASTLAGWHLRSVAGEQPSVQFSKSVLFNLGALGSLALLVAWFLIYQICVMWLRRQRIVMERLVALGVGRAVLARYFYGAVASLGCIATAIGLAGGYYLAQFLTDLSTAGFTSVPRIEMSFAVTLKAVISGVAVALVGAWIAFRSRTHFFETAVPRRSAVHWWLPVAVVLFAAGVLVRQSGLAGGFVSILAASLVAAAVVAPLLRRVRRMVVRLPGSLLAKLAMREVTWFEGDLGVAVGALVLAIATSMGVGLMVESFKADFERMLDQRLAHEAFVDLAGQDGLVVADALKQRFADAEVQAYGRLRARIDGAAVELGFTRFDATESARYGYDGALAVNAALVSESLTVALDVGVGDTLTLAGRELTIVHAFSGFGDVQPRLLIDEITAEQIYGKLLFDRLSVAGVPSNDLLAWFGARSGAAPRIQQRDAMRRVALEVFDRTFAMTNALTLLALFVAVIGLYNAITALRLNQLATSDLLDALGLNRGEKRRVDLMRGLAIGVFAVMLALPLGLIMGVVLCQVINPRAFGWSIDLQLSASALLWPLGLGIAAAVLAGLVPTPRERLGSG